MISSVIQYGSLLVVRDETGQQIGSISTGGGEFLGYSGTFILLKYGSMVISMDENQRHFGSTIIPEDYIITGITNSGFLARTGNILLVYDRYCNHTDTQSI
jgi:hypothetical protein